ncbi:MAG: hypothetical protein R3F54_17845 [Alphaproteobacteria bacterium]
MGSGDLKRLAKGLSEVATLPRLSGRPGKVHRAGLVIGSKAWSGVLQPGAE